MDLNTYFDLGSSDEKWFCDKNCGWPFDFTDSFFELPSPCSSEALNVSNPSSTVSNSLFDELRSVKSCGRRFVSIGHSNVRGLLKSLSEVKILIEQTNLDILTISETHLSEAVLDNEVYIAGYQLLRRDRYGKAGGGVAIYVKDELNCVRFSKYDVPDLEAIWIEVCALSQRLLVGCLYRPPDRTDFFDKFRSVMEKMWLSRKNVVIAGDFNADQLSSNCNGSKLKRICQSFNFRNLIDRPTRIATTSSTLLDLILTNNFPKIFKSGVIDYSIADHKFVFAVFMLKKPSERPILKKVYSYKKLIENKTDFKYELENAPWWVCSVFDNLEDITWAWESMYKDILDDYVSPRDAKIRRFSLPWINSEIRKAINKRYKLLRACDGSPLAADTWVRYKHARNEVTKLLRKAEAFYWKERFAESKDSKSFWKTVSDATGKHRSCKIGTLNGENDEELVDDYDKAERLNQFFINVGKNLADRFPNACNLNQHIYRVTPSIQYLELNYNRLLYDLKNIKSNKASGPDDISARSLAIAGSSAAAGLSMVFQQCLTTNSFPVMWKMAKINAIFKKGCKTEVSNYRPISLLSIPSKLLESQVCHIIDEHLANSGVKTRKQWGFCKGLSTESMLLTMTEKWKQALDNSLCVGAVFIDFQKAFDTVSHPILSRKLHAIGISGSVHEWIMCYLTNRSQYTVVNGCKSSPGCIQFGVPQGSLLGPRLYSIFVNDLPDCVGDIGEVYLYADDTTLSVIGHSVDDVFAALNIMVDNVLQWSKNNQLTIHPIKTEAMLIRKSPFIGPLPPLYFGSGIIRIVESTTCLGVKLDCRLSWYKHVSQARKSFAQKVKAMKRMKYLPIETLQEIYFKTIMPSVIYCILIWGNCSTALFSNFNSIHSRAARIIFNLDSSISDDECLLNSHWPSFSYFYKKSVLVFMHKVYFDSLSFCPDELFSKKVSGRSLRAVNQMFIPRPRSEIGRNSLRYRGPVIWNYVNKITKVSTSLNSFKVFIKKSKAELEAFSFNKEVAIVTMKSKDFNYF